MFRPFAALVLGVAVSCALTARVAHADETHYQSVFMGDRAFGMAGAATGLSADTAAVYYNPGALAELPNRSFSASLGLNAFERYRIVEGARTSATAADLVQNGRRSLPVFSGALLRFGPRGRDGLKRHAVAFATLHPASAARTLSVDLVDPMTGITSSARVNRAFRQTFYGLAYALHISPEIAVGITAFLAIQRLTHDETVLGGSGGTAQPDGSFTGVSSFARIMSFRSRAYSLLPRIGVFWRPNHTWSFGVTFQPPNLTLKNKAYLREQTQLTMFDPMGMGMPTQTFNLSTNNDIGVRLPIPWMIRWGAGVHPTEHSTIALDMVLHGPVSGGPRITGLHDEFPGFFFADDTRRVVTLDLSLGVEWTVHDGITVRAGVFTNRSAAPEVPRTASSYQVEDIESLGATFGVGAHLGGYHLTFGIAGLRGRGDALSANTDLTATDIYARTRVDSRVIYFFITGATRSAARLARSAMQRVRDRHQDGEGGSGGGRRRGGASEQESEAESAPEVETEEPPATPADDSGAMSVEPPAVSDPDAAPCSGC